MHFTPEQLVTIQNALVSFIVAVVGAAAVAIPVLIKSLASAKTAAAHAVVSTDASEVSVDASHDSIAASKVAQDHAASAESNALVSQSYAESMVK